MAGLAQRVLPADPPQRFGQGSRRGDGLWRAAELGPLGETILLPQLLLRW